LSSKDKQKTRKKFELKKLYYKIRNKFFKKDKEYEVAKDFHNSKLGGKSLLFTNEVGLIFFRNIKDDWDCVTTMVGTVRDCRECLPKNSIIKYGGIQFVIESKEELTDDTIQRMENFGFMFQHSDVPCIEGQVYHSIFFQQDPDFWSKDFENFLRTYPDFLRNRYKEITNES